MMACNGEQVYENPTASPPTQCKQTTKGKQSDAGSLFLKAAPILSLLLLVVVFITMIGLHFQQQSELEKDQNNAVENYDQLSEAVGNLVGDITVLKNKTQGFEGERASMQDIVTSLKRNLSRVEENFVSVDLIETSDFTYKRKCYFLLMTDLRADRPEAEASCRGKGGRLADILDRTHFEKAKSLIRSKAFAGLGYNHIWTGMNMDIQQRRIRLSTGEWAPYVTWYPGRPHSPVRAGVGFHVDTDVGSLRNGMFDSHISGKLHGGLCQKSIN